MSGKYTAGPWVLYVVDGDFVISGAMGEGSPFVANLVRQCDTLRVTDDDARLIAAAPDLLAALELIHANAGESVEWIRRHTSAAIAKAKGGQS